LDEPDANIHPSALRRLLEIAQRHHAKRRLVIVTHSNAVLDELREPAKQIRVVEASRDGAVVRTLDAEALAAWRDRYALSELRRRGQLDESNANYASRRTTDAEVVPSRRTTETEVAVAAPSRNGSRNPAVPKKTARTEKRKGRRA